MTVVSGKWYKLLLSVMFLADTQQNALLSFPWCWEPAPTLPSIQPIIPCRFVHLLFLDLEAILEMTPTQSLIQQMFPSPSQRTAMNLSYSECEYQGGVSKKWRNPRFSRATPASPIQSATEQPSGCSALCQLGRIHCWSSASWDVAKIICSPQQTLLINLRLRGNKLSVRWGMLPS